MTEIDTGANVNEFGDSINQIMTVQHVDPVLTNRVNAQYFLTVRNTGPAPSNVFIRGPITFTAAEIDI